MDSKPSKASQARAYSSLKGSKNRIVRDAYGQPVPFQKLIYGFANSAWLAMNARSLVDRCVIQVRSFVPWMVEKEGEPKCG